MILFIKYCTDKNINWEYLSYPAFKFQIQAICNSFEIVLSLLKDNKEINLLKKLTPIFDETINNLAEKLNDEALKKTTEKGKLTRVQEDYKSKLELIKDNKKREVLEILFNKNAQNQISFENKIELCRCMELDSNAHAPTYIKNKINRLLKWKTLTKRRKNLDYLLTNSELRNILTKIKWI